MNFFQELGIKHHVAPSHFPGANEQIERAVQTVKNSLTKAAEKGKDLYAVLLDYRIQPAKDMPSPAELLMERKLRTFLPSHLRLLKSTFDVERAREALRKRQIIQNKYANKHATVLPVLHQNAKVWYKQKNGRALEARNYNSSSSSTLLIYNKKRGCGGIFRRNGFHIRLDYSENDNLQWSQELQKISITVMLLKFLEFQMTLQTVKCNT
ncbi:integrase catalytic domain-containing protein [Trichonephila clavipes]|nr:integrase catalytic domain-containing protein [Trichonephila clavipes]